MFQDKRVLAAVDFSPGSRRALGEAVRICKTLDRKLHVIHVVEGRVVETLADLLQKPLVEARRQALTRAREALARLVGEAGAPADTRLHVAVGAPVAEILSCVEAVEPDLLVLGERALTRPRMRAESLPGGGTEQLPIRVLMVNEGGARG